ncbi:histidine triad nucleotide-binding protein [Alicyclobacillus acidiphilus]|uniref:histidine triad nucleotide-binding protein n=1 Tax=Alicyclobacillus acidiphilus TaxID=182455 RepID=UPI001C3F2255|nr:histidine triad nucleotide-binding protein [Alicyclobacillus acidiphilus]
MDRVEDCLFCKLVAGEIPSEKLYEDDVVLAFQDIRPQAPVHVLVIPKRHIASAQTVTAEDANVLGHLHAVIPQVAEKTGIAEKGYRVVTNIGHHGQQTVPHLHYHVIGGRQLGWPPG